MRIRGATKADFCIIEKLLKDYDFELEFKHLESLVVVEDSLGVIAVGSLQTILEAMFIVDRSIRKRAKAKALKLLLKQAEVEVQNLGFDNYHSFATNDGIKKILIKRDAKPVKGEVLITWVKPPRK